MVADGRPWRTAKGGLVLQVRLTPKSSRDGVQGLKDARDGSRLGITVRAIPAKGEANAALIGVLAKWLGLPQDRLELAAGGKSRSKSVAIAGDATEIARRIEAKLKAEA